MKNSTAAVWLLGATLVIGGCSRASEGEVRDSATVLPQNTDASAAGTSGLQSSTSEPTPATPDLPDTASPLALIAGIGVLSLCAAAGLRLMR